MQWYTYKSNFKPITRPNQAPRNNSAASKWNNFCKAVHRHHGSARLGVGENDNASKQHRSRPPGDAERHYCPSQLENLPLPGPLRENINKSETAPPLAAPARWPSPLDPPGDGIALSQNLEVAQRSWWPNLTRPRYATPAEAAICPRA